MNPILTHACVKKSVPSEKSSSPSGYSLFCDLGLACVQTNDTDSTGLLNSRMVELNSNSFLLFPVESVQQRRKFVRLHQHCLLEEMISQYMPFIKHVNKTSHKLRRHRFTSQQLCVGCHYNALNETVQQQYYRGV